MDIEIILEGLNESQRHAVTAPDCPVLVVAGPGTGKTLTIVRRIAYLIAKGLSFEEICALTFTNRAASELKQRIRAFYGGLNGLFAGTFHLLGLRLLREFSGEDFYIISREEQIELIKRISGAGKPSVILERISRVKNLVDKPDEKLKKIINDYYEILLEKKALDYDDLLIRAIELLSDPSFKSRYSRTMRYLLVDEYQDINPLQLKMLKMLSVDKIFAVGDPDQSIYSFRGANVENFINFEKEYPHAVKIVLDKNYRSQPFIVKASETFIENNKERIPRNIVSIKREGLPVKIVSLPDDRAEIDFIVKEIEKRMGGMSHYSLMKGMDVAERSDYVFSDFAVLFRTNNQVLAMESELKKAGIPCYAMGRTFIDSIKEIILYLEENKDKPLELLISELRKKYKIINSLMADYIPSSTDDLISWLKLTGPEEDRLQAEGVRLLTIHMSKGLEFRVVFISGLEEGLIPIEPENLEEERRLLYVAMTRAKEELYLLQARRRKLYGKTEIQKPSSFLSEIKEEFVETLYLPDRYEKERQLGLF
ncbi:MAG: ATP-dependent helicase [Thermodesulfovibrionales bacterium]|nr:ATP-dependent helicase [Thermodesulfovibrionales bacterium]